MAEVEVKGVTHRYGRVTALSGVDLEIPRGALYALLGPNGAGKTTLLQVVMGLRRPTSGEVRVLGQSPGHLKMSDRARIGYVAEGQRLPGWMTVRELERYLAPLYPGWDARLADDLRGRFRLDPGRRIRHLSRGERMKAALLLAVAPRPRVLFMDEPFSGMDPVTRDDLVRGLLELSGEGGWTAVISSHDLGELEPLADWVGFLDAGRLRLSAPMDVVRDRFRRVEVTLPPGAASMPPVLPGEWLSLERSGPLVRFIATDGGASLDDAGRAWPPADSRVDVAPASLREVFLALARQGAAGLGPDASAMEVAA